jgi:hypothetical protein
MTVESHAIRQARRLLTYIVEENGTPCEVCTRRSNNPSVKRPDIPVAPEQKSGSR